MLILSVRWSALVCTATVLLGCLVPVTLTQDIRTSQTFKVLTDGDDMGGSCTSRLDQVDQLVPEVQQLIKAAMETIDEILEGSADPVFNNEKKKNRLRMVLLARRFFGTEVSKHRLAVESDDSKRTLNAVKENFGQIKKQIEKKDKNWRFACDDTWAKHVTKLQTKYGTSTSGTPIEDVPGLGGVQWEWAFFDRGGERLRPARDDHDVEIQATWYISQGKRWSSDGPCAGITGDGRTVYADAETLQDQKLVYFCPRLWDGVGQRLKRDVREFKNTNIKTDGTELLDHYASPATILLHEMTHQVFSSEDNPPVGLGYFFENVQKGQDHPQQAVGNADSYPYFAVAAYLSQVQWHTGSARQIGYKGS